MGGQNGPCTWGTEHLDLVLGSSPSWVASWGLHWILWGAGFDSFDSRHHLQIGTCMLICRIYGIIPVHEDDL